MLEPQRLLGPAMRLAASYRLPLPSMAERPVSAKREEERSEARRPSASSWMSVERRSMMSWDQQA